VAKDGVEIPRDEEVKIEEIFFSGNVSRKRWDELGKIAGFSGP